MSAGSDRQPSPGRSALRRVGGALLVVIAVVAVLVVIGRQGMSAAAAAEARDAFLSALRRGDLDAAYAKLSTRRRAQLSRDAFAALTDHPAFRRHGAADFRAPKARSPGLCTYGSLEVDGQEWAAEIFLTEEGGGWRVHAFAIQAPAPSQLGILLHECGYGAGTLLGYSGPPVEHATVPIDP